MVRNGVTRLQLSKYKETYFMINEIGVKLTALNYQLQAEKVHTWKLLLFP